MESTLCVRGMTRTAVIALVVVLNAACVAHFQDYQPVRVPGINKMDVEISGSPAEFVKLLRQTGVSNMTIGHGLTADGKKTVDVVMADYLKHLYIFVGGEFAMKAKIPHDKGKGPVHPTVKVVRAGDRTAVVLIADVMHIDGKQAGLLVTFDEKEIKSTVKLPVWGFIKKHDGMRDPYIGGTDMKTGILVTARNADGTAWTRIYVLKLVKNEVKLSSRHFSEGGSCACFYDWVSGQDGPTLFGRCWSRGAREPRPGGRCQGGEWAGRACRFPYGISAKM